MYPVKLYTIVLPEAPTPNERRAASFLREKIRLVTGALLPVLSDATPSKPYELAVGRTSRETLDGMAFERSRAGVWQYVVRARGERIYLTGLGVPDTTPGEYLSAYRYVDDGGQGTVFAAYHFVEQILGYDFLRGDFELSPSFCDAAIPEDYTFEYTTSSLRSPRLPIYDSDAMYMLPVTSHLDWNIMSFIFRTSDGRLAVIDGGHPEETEAMLGALTQLSGGETPIVDVWFVTHLHSDHYGVLTELCSDSGKYSGRVKVKKLCHALLPREFYSDISRERGSVPAGAWDVLNNAAATLSCEVVRLAEGDSVSVCGLDFYVLHTPDCVEAGLLPKMNMNDSSMVLRLTAGGQRLLFLSDGEWICNRQLLGKHRDELAADVVQIAHHGCGNVSDECYAAIGAKVYLMQAGNRFYYSDGGEGLNSHNTGMIRTRRLLCRLGVKEICDRNRALGFALPMSETQTRRAIPTEDGRLRQAHRYGR